MVAFAFGFSPIQRQDDEINKITQIYQTDVDKGTRMMKSLSDLCVYEGENEQANFQSLQSTLNAKLRRAKERLTDAEYELANCKRKRRRVDDEEDQIDEKLRACKRAEFKTTTRIPEIENVTKGKARTGRNRLK